MYLTDTKTIDLYNDISSNFSELISFFPSINWEIYNNYGINYEFSYVYNQSFVNYPLKENTKITELLLMGLFETRKQIHQNIEIIHLFNPIDNTENNKGILYNLIKNWGPFGDNILNDNCLKIIKLVMEYITKKVQIEFKIYEYVEEMDLSKNELDNLISNISKIDIKRKSIEDIQDLMQNLTTFGKKQKINKKKKDNKKISKRKI